MKLKETKEVVDFIISFAEALAASLNDGHLSVTDAIHFWEPISNISDAVEGFEDVLEEIKHLSEDDMHDLCEYIIEEFDIDQDDVEEMIEKALQTGVTLLTFVSKLRG